MARDLTLPLFSRIVGMDGMVVPNYADGKGSVITANVELIRVNDGAARAPHETCLRQTSDPLIG
jgi:hypothetical protein